MGNYMTNSILNNLINFLAPVVGIALIVFCVIQAFKIFSGSEGGSVKKLVSRTIMLLFILGIMYAAGSFHQYGQFFKGITDSVITRGVQDADDILR